MSFGFSITDIVFLLGKITQIVGLLAGNAVEGFRRLRGVCRDLSRYVECLQVVLDDNKSGAVSVFGRELNDIQKNIKTYKSTIQKLEKDLGRNRERTVRGFCRKICWPQNSKRLEQEASDLRDKLNTLALKISLRPNFLRDDYGMKFYLEDTRGQLHIMDFTVIFTWESLHMILLDVFPEGDGAHMLVKNRHYLIHKSQPEVDILCSSPVIQDLRDVIGLHERVSMSMIFPYQRDFMKNCPRCRTRRSAEYEGPFLSPKCPLQIRFRKSAETEMDPLTAIAFNAVKGADSSGIPRFLQEFRGGSGVPQPGRGANPREILAGFKPWAEKNVPAESLYQTSGAGIANQLYGIHRLTICQAIWPKLNSPEEYKEADATLNKTMDGLQNTVAFLNAEDFPFAIAMRFFNCNFGYGRYHKATLDFLKSIVDVNNSRRDFLSQRQGAYNQFVQTFYGCGGMRAPEFHPASVRLRCFFWMYPQFLEAEAKILHLCSTMLSPWSMSPNPMRRKTPLLFKVLFSPHILFLPVLKAMDISWDIIDLVGKFTPAYAPSAMRHLLDNANTVGFEQELNNGLGKYLESSRLMDSNISNEHLPACREWMTKVIDSKGEREQMVNLDLWTKLEEAFMSGFS